MSLMNAARLSQNYILLEDSNLFLVTGSRYKNKNQMLPSRLVSFVQKNLPASDTVRVSKKTEIANLGMYTFLVINTGLNPVICQSEISPDGITWGGFGESEYSIAPGQMQVVVPQYFMRFARIKFRNKNPGFNSYVTIWFQGQRI